MLAEREQIGSFELPKDRPPIRLLKINRHRHVQTNRQTQASWPEGADRLLLALRHPPGEVRSLCLR
jgi:hypothetical protein